MQNLILYPTSSPSQNLSKNEGRYVENMNKKSSFFYDTYPKIYIKNLFKTKGISNLKQFHSLKHDDMEFELGLKGPF